MSLLPPLSFEFSAPKDDAALARLMRSHERLSALAHDYVSVTYGAGGSTRDGTLEAVFQLSDTGADVAPHLSFGSDTPDKIRGLLDQYQTKGIKRLVALRGDRQSGVSTSLAYAAELVAFIREEHGTWFDIEVAAYPELHPESPTLESELLHFKTKVDAGANGAITQYFYASDAYFRFRDECLAQGIDIPITPGIMPITNLAGIKRFSAVCGADIPRWILRRLESLEDDSDSLKAFGEEVVTSLCEQLIQGGVPSLHFYTLNQSKPTLRLCKNLGY